MGRELFIVSRERPELYRYLSQTFADADKVVVIWDRRMSERRGPPKDAVPERRRRDRRARPAVDEEIRAVGYAFLAL